MTYCNRCGIPHDPKPCRRLEAPMPNPRPKTAAERLDAAKDGREFAAVIMELFEALDKARHEESNDDR